MAKVPKSTQELEEFEAIKAFLQIAEDTKSSRLKTFIEETLVNLEEAMEPLVTQSIQDEEMAYDSLEEE